MKYILTCCYADDDKHGVFSYALSHYEGILFSDQIIAVGDRKNDKSYCGHIALRRALRDVSKRSEGVASLTLKFDDVLIENVAYELIENINTPVYPSLAESSKRALRRFQSYEFAKITTDLDVGLSVDEATALDECESKLDELKTLKGRLELLKLRLVCPHKIIR
ncbi:hypothetical protein ACH0CI_26775 [Priestia sp. 179-F W1.4 NHS]|uniref:hypothetical protein n=1 Tax=Priestia sp. 179-F W1.4 NHS TaxID=3374296 RepID=UPI00387908AA